MCLTNYLNFVNFGVSYTIRTRQWIQCLSRKWYFLLHVIWLVYILIYSCLLNFFCFIPCSNYWKVKCWWTSYCNFILSKDSASDLLAHPGTLRATNMPGFSPWKQVWDWLLAYGPLHPPALWLRSCFRVCPNSSSTAAVAVDVLHRMVLVKCNNRSAKIWRKTLCTRDH